MEELGGQRGAERPNEGSRSSRTGYWFAQQLGDEWETAEPGIYRYIGPSTPMEDPAVLRDSRDRVDLRGRHRPEFDVDQHPATEQEQRRTG